MKQIILYIFLLLSTVPVFAQFADTAALNQYIRETLKDRRPNKVSISDIQTGFLGVTSFLGTGAGTQVTDTLTRGEAEEQVMNKSLVAGRSYCITNADENLYGGTTIVLKAISNSQFSADGVGYFYNPDYRNGEYSLWLGDLAQATVSDVNGYFEPGEQIYTENNLTAAWIKEGWLILEGVNGTWITGEPAIVYGANYGGSAVVEVTSVATYAIGDKVIWGGKVWVNTTGNRGFFNDDLTLNTEDWEVQPYTAPDYILAVDPIKYDWANNMIIGRREDIGDNEVYSSLQSINENGNENPIKYFQWGNPYLYNTSSGIGSQRIINSFNKNINFRGIFQTHIDLRENSSQYSVYCLPGSSQTNIKMRRQSGQSLLYLMDCLQQNLSFTGSQQYRVTISDCSQVDIILHNGRQHNLYLQNDQSNINIFGRYWDRENIVLTENEEGIFKLPPAGLTVRQTEFLPQYNSVSSIYQQPTVVFCPELEYEMEVGMNYTFEYDLSLSVSMPPNSMEFHLDIPDADRKYMKFTLYDQANNTDTTIASTTSGDIVLPYDGSGNNYHLKIVGSVLNSQGGPARFSFNPTYGPYGGGITVTNGSNVKFTKATWISTTPPPI